MNETRTNRSIVFLLITFGWSWVSWLIALRFLSDGIDVKSIERFLPYFFMGVYGPLVGAITTSLIYGGAAEMRQTLLRLFIWKVPISIYLGVILLPIFFLGSGIAVYAMIHGSAGIFENKMAVIPMLLLNAVYIGPLGEELGWRGYLLPELQKKNPDFQSGVIVGVIHFAWHIPLFWAPFGALVSGEDLSLLSIFLYLILVVSWSLVQTWLAINSRGSVLIAVLFHLFINAGVALIFFPEIATNAARSKEVYYLSAIVTVPVAIIVCILGLKKKPPLIGSKV